MKKISFIFCLCLFNNLLAQTNYQEGLKSYDEDNYDQSIMFFTKSIDEGYEVAKSYKMRGASYIQLRLYETAIIDLEKSVKLDSTDFKVYTYIGKTLTYSGLHKSAIVYYSKSIEINEIFVDNYFERAQCKYAIKDFLGCIRDLNSAIKLNPKNEDYYGLKGSALGGLKQYTEAIKEFDYSLSIAPSSLAYGGKGEMFARMGDDSKAIIYYSKSIDMDSENEIILYLRGMSYAELGKFNLACKDLGKSSELGLTQATTDFVKICNLRNEN